MLCTETQETPLSASSDARNSSADEGGGEGGKGVEVIEGAPPVDGGASCAGKGGDADTGDTGMNPTDPSSSNSSSTPSAASSSSSSSASPSSSSSSPSSSSSSVVASPPPRPYVFAVLILIIDELPHEG